MEVTMKFHATAVIDNRDAQEMYTYLEARVETLKRRITELEAENEMLRAVAYANDSALELGRSA
jgi:hypothetical protein